jgi:hypothetical protein
MKTRLFEIFTETLDCIPDKGITRVVELEQRMLENDLSKHRINQDRDVNSILTFCQLLNIIKLGGSLLPLELPILHVAYYRTIINRLIKAGEFSADVMDKFDDAAGWKDWGLWSHN